MNERKAVEMYCGRCNRKLRSEKSRLVGYGPTCEKKNLIENERVFSEFKDYKD